MATSGVRACARSRVSLRLTDRSVKESTKPATLVGETTLFERWRTRAIPAPVVASPAPAPSQTGVRSNPSEAAMSEPILLSSPDALILVAQRGAVRTLTLNRPASLNSFTTDMHAELRAALDAAA